MGGGEGMESMAGGGPGMMGGGRGMMGEGGMGGADAAAKKLTTLTRTDFLIQFAWQPPTTAAPPKAIDEIRKELIEAEKAKGSVKIPTEDDLDKVSQQASQKFVNDFLTSAKATAPPAEGSAFTPAAAPAGDTPKK